MDVNFDCGSGTVVVPAKEPIYLYDTADMINRWAKTKLHLTKLAL